ncbi:RIP metalloprotease RseP [Alkalithermobacter paradoxus]|uniref:Zinc metalloprotease n=1 Tax=Alkalithermobacter paradoxus TaxID=29349 RepID=A0A1V4IC81_9FIRM|nr:regulator of sigma-W protease RasP [[Clostridium] thermoalcaliphilum]
MTIFISLIVFGVIVLFHEFGHFIVAKATGVKVHEFAIGMGPKIFSRKGVETEYTLRVLPLGGYIRMEGEDASSDDPRSFNKKSVPERAGIILAGPIMNFILSIALFTFIFVSIGVPTTVIKSTIENRPAREVGLQAGDKIVEIDQSKIKTWEDVINKIGNSPGKDISIKVKRNDELLTYNVRTIEENGRAVIGIIPKEEKNILLALRYGFQRVIYILNDMILFLGRAISGRASSSEIAGPVGILNLVGQAAETGILNVVSLAAVISLNLGLLNLLPIPALDGSRVLFLIVEALRGKKIDPEKEGTVHLIGFVLLMTLMIFVTYKDILRIIK